MRTVIINDNNDDKIRGGHGNWYIRDLCLVSCEWLSFDSVNIDSNILEVHFVCIYNINSMLLFHDVFNFEQIKRF